MSTRLARLLPILVFVVMAGCKKKTEPMAVTGWEQFRDPYIRITFRYPRGWYVVTEGGKINVYSSAGAAQKFFDPTSKNEEGIQMVIAHEKVSGPMTLDALTDSVKTSLASAGYSVPAVDQMMVDSTSARRIRYTGQFDERTKLEAERIVAIKDSVSYSFTYAAFNGLFAPNRFVFDTMLASIQLPRPRSVAWQADPSLPSNEFDVFSNNVLDISYPGNFEAAVVQPKGEMQFSLEIKGYRQDSDVRLDVFPAKGLTVDKVFEQNAKFFKATSHGTSTIDGIKALDLNYAPARNIESKAYFMVKNDKVYRIIINYFQPARKEFLPAFEKTVASLHVK